MIKDMICITFVATLATAEEQHHKKRRKSKSSFLLKTSRMKSPNEKEGIDIEMDENSKVMNIYIEPPT